jgi:hypothetical protein
MRLPFEDKDLKGSLILAGATRDESSRREPGEKYQLARATVRAA